MKTKLFLILLFISSYTFAQYPYTNLVGQYGFDNGSFVDGANGANFVQTGAALTNVADRYATANNAINVGGDYLTRSDIAFTGTNTFNISYSFWVKTSTNNTDVQTIIDDSTRDNGAGFDSNDIGYFIYLRNGTIRLSSRFYTRFNVSSSVTAKGYGQNSTKFIADGNWHHIVVEFTSVPGTISSKIYVDSVAQSKSTNFDTIYTSPNTTGNVTLSNSRTNHLTAINQYKDVIDDILLYDRVLTPSEIISIGTYGGFCFTPDSAILSTSAITNTSATINIANAGTFDVAYHKTGEAFSSAIIVTGVSTSTILTALDEFEDYDVYIREICSSTTTSWSSAINFQTTRTVGRIYVNHAATGTNNGVSWANAYTTLIDALSNVQDSEEIWVAQGTYNPSATADRSDYYSILNNDLKIYGGFNATETLLSQRDFNGNSTIFSGDLNGNDDTTIAYVNTTRDDNSYNIFRTTGTNFLLDGVTVTGAHSNGATTGFNRGGGLYMNPVSEKVTIKNSVFTKNVSNVMGAGVYARYTTTTTPGELTIKNCEFSNNFARQGTGVYATAEANSTLNVNISNSLFANNEAANINASTLGNSGSSSWLRASASGSNLIAKLVNNTYANNIDTGTASSLNNFTRATLGLTQNSTGIVDATVANCIFWGNTTAGGTIARSITGIHQTLASTLLVTNSIDQQNFSVVPAGSQVNTNNNDPLFVDSANNDFTLQTASPAKDTGENSYIDAIYSEDLLGTPRVSNNIVDMGSYEFDSGVTTTHQLTISKIGNGTLSPAAGTITCFAGMNLTLTATPEVGNWFNGWTGTTTEANNSFTILIDADKTYTANFSVINRFYVDENATGNNDGSSWADAYTDLQTALANDLVNIPIWIAQGTYTPHASNRGSFFNFNRDNVTLYGGFNGTETLLSQRNIQANPTILSGDLNGDDTGGLTFATAYGRAENSYHVVRIQANGVSLDGLQINDAQANSAATSANFGGGIWILDAVTSFTLKNCKLKKNVAKSGSAIRFYNTNDATITIENSIFEDNYSRTATLYMVTNSTNKTLTVNLTNNLFFKNRTSNVNGAELGTTGSAAWIRANSTGSTVNTNITNCTFSKNIDAGTAPGTQHGTLGLSKRTDGNATHNATINNSIFYNNTSSSSTVLAINRGSTGSVASTTSIFNSIDENNFSNITNLTNTSNLDPLFTNPNSDFTLQPSSPAIDAGDNSLVPAGINLDLVGNQRITNTTVDMGCYESSYTLYNLITSATGSGSVSPSGTTQVNDGATISITATPSIAHSFSHWTGDATGNTNPISVTVDAPKNITAVFIPTPPTYVDIDATGNNDGTSWVDAYTDLRTALINAAPSDVIWIAEGTYTPDASNKTKSFVISQNNVTIYGGFDGTETTLADRDFLNNPTILSGDLNGDDTGVDFTGNNRSENSYNIVKITANNIAIDGFKIEDGNARGGAILHGAGIYTTGSVSGSITLKNCEFNKNVGNTGGAIRSYFSNNVNFTIENCSFNNNLSRYGSSLYLLVNNNKTVTANITNCLFTNNVSKNLNGTNKGYTGSAMWMRANGTASNLTTTITNCTFANNNDIGTQAGSERGTLGLSKRADGNSTHTVNINNSIFYGNTGASNVTTLAVNKGHTGSTSASTFIYNSIDEDDFSNLTNKINTSNADPLFTDSANSDFTLQSGSPAIDTGDNTKLPAGITADLLEAQRIFNTTVDMGVYEFGSALLGVADFFNNELNFSIYPNPTQHILNVRLSETFEQAVIYNLMGAKVLESTTSNINVSHLTSGIYLIKVKDNNGGIAAKRFIKQ